MATRNVKEETRATYGVSTDDEIIAKAMAILDSRLQRGEQLNSPEYAGNFLKLKLQPYEREVFAALFLNSKHEVLGYEELFFGTVDGAEIHPREVVKAALRKNATAIIVAHNHPSGSPEPSAADRAVTARLKQALATVDVRLLDHFVIGHGAPMSMAARGLV